MSTATEEIEYILKMAQPEVIDQAKQILTQVAPIAQQVLAGVIAPANLEKIDDLNEALAAANQLDDRLAGLIEDKKKAHDLAMKILVAAGQLALKFAIAGLA